MNVSAVDVGEAVLEIADGVGGLAEGKIFIYPQSMSQQLFCSLLHSILICLQKTHP